MNPLKLTEGQKAQYIKEHQEMLEILHNEYKDTASRLKLAIAEKASHFTISNLKRQVQEITVDGKAVRKALDEALAW